MSDEIQSTISGHFTEDGKTFVFRVRNHDEEQGAEFAMERDEVEAFVECLRDVLEQWPKHIPTRPRPKLTGLE